MRSNNRQSEAAENPRPGSEEALIFRIKEIRDTLVVVPDSFTAEKGGFEPPVQLPVRQFSKLLVSATHPSLLSFVKPMCCSTRTRTQTDRTRICSATITPLSIVRTCLRQRTRIRVKAAAVLPPPQNLLQSFLGPHSYKTSCRAFWGPTLRNQIIFFGTRLRGVRGAFLRKRVQKYCFFLT